MKIKVCGIMDNKDLGAIASSGADLVGFIFAASSPRYAVGKIDPAVVAKISAEYPSLKKVGVFVNEKVDRIKEVVKRYGLDVVQLHGNESLEDCKALSDEVEVIKTIPVKDASSFEKCAAYESVIHTFLFDTSGPLAGGNGFAFDWNLLEKYKGNVPFYLSGGIGPSDTIRISALRTPFSRLTGVDVNSKFELYPGKKNITLVNTFVNNIKQQHHELRSI